MSASADPLKLRHVIAPTSPTGEWRRATSLSAGCSPWHSAAKLSQLLGEASSTACSPRGLGLAAIDVNAPVPFTALPRRPLFGICEGPAAQREPRMIYPRGSG